MNRLIIFLLFISFTANAQHRSGKIVYERKTNLYKKFKDEDVKSWIKEADRTKTDYFELLFDDSLTLFRPQLGELREKYSWATEKNTVYQDLRTNTRFTIKQIWGEDVSLSDTLFRRTWKITDSKRNIAGYMCRKAVWQANDSTTIYAWYCDELMTPAGPESFIGLPGMILGVATEDGGVIYFAKSVELTNVDKETLRPPSKKKVYTPAELRKQLEDDYGKEKWGKAMIKTVFGYW